MVLMRNLMNQIANMGGSQDTLHQIWNSLLEGINHSQDSGAGVGCHIGSDGLSFIENLLILLNNSSPPTWFLLLYDCWCQLCLAMFEAHVKLGERVPKMVGTGQIKFAKLILMPDGDFTWHSKNCSLDRLPYRTSLC